MSINTILFIDQNCHFMSISVPKNHLPDIGARRVEKGLSISTHTITHLKQPIFIYNVINGRQIYNK